MQPVSQQLVIDTNSAEETQALGRRLGERVLPGDLFLLHGTLGAGKTTLVQGIAWGAGVTDYAHSPTFVLVHEYSGRILLYHIDLYRLEGGNIEAHELGIDEMLADGACVVEWAEKAPEVFSGEQLSVTMEFGTRPNARRITLVPRGARYRDIVAQLQATRIR